MMATAAEGSNKNMVAGFSPAAGKKTAGLIEKETNSSPRSSQRTLRKTIVNNLCVLCGEILIGNGIGSHEVSYKRRRWPEQRPVKSNEKLMNVEHRTSNVQHRIMYSVYFIIKRLSEAKPPFDIRYSIFCGSAVRF
jgi:hypothetical protein